MSLDTKYRPRTYRDVLGQESAIRILRSYVTTNKGWDQSYLFAGPWGSGKTTMARVLARALLCSAPVDGEPCDKCFSCTSILEGGESHSFVEIDAATNSSKESIQKIIEEIQYDTFSGSRRLYLFDEAHRLSHYALDAMLKPLEEHKLVCIFATTEPERMKETVFSRCAPAFLIQPVTPDQIAERLAYVCTEEKIEFERDMLVVIAEMTECHIRDALKAIEGVSMLGPVNRDNVVSYLHLDQNDVYVDILDAIGKDLPKALDAARNAMKKVSPATCYEKLADLAMLVFQVGIGAAKIPAYMNVERVTALAKSNSTAMLGYASRFASRPGHPTAAMLQCDLGVLHHTGGVAPSDAVVIMAHAPPGAQSHPVTAASTVHSAPSATVPAPTAGFARPPDGKMLRHGMDVEVKPRAEAVNDGRVREGQAPAVVSSQSETTLTDASLLLGRFIREELKRSGSGSTR
jgi:DNA polymerase III subunit gamma/tau